MTPRLIDAAFAAKAKQFDREHDRTGWLAWHTGLLARWPSDSKYPFPELSALQSARVPAAVEPQTEAQSMAFFKSIAGD